MKILKGYKAQWIANDGSVLLSKNNILFEYNPLNKKIDELLRLDYNNKALNLIGKGLVERVSRGGVHHVIKLKERIIIFFDNRILTLDGDELVSMYHIKTCKRPLNICVHPKYRDIYWGDYIASSERVPINIYCSKDDGLSWDIVFTFPDNTIRHIHNIIFDEIRCEYLILTGDEDNESGIWATKDFNKVEPILIGQQQYRATSLIVKNDYYVLPTDTEIEQNYIQKFDINNKSIQPILDVPSSSIDAKEISGYSFVSLMVEPSKVNITKSVNLYVSDDDTIWSKIFSVKKDILSGKYFQYASIQIPKYEYKYNGRNFYFNLINTNGGSGVLILNSDDIRQSLTK